MFNRNLLGPCNVEDPIQASGDACMNKTPKSLPRGDDQGYWLMPTRCWSRDIVCLMIKSTRKENKGEGIRSAREGELKF